MTFADHLTFIDKVDTLGYDIVNTCVFNNKQGLLDDMERWEMRDEDDLYTHWIVALYAGYIYIKAPRYKHMKALSPVFSRVYYTRKEVLDVYEYHTGRTKNLPPE